MVTSKMNETHAKNGYTHVQEPELVVDDFDSALGDLVSSYADLSEEVSLESDVAAASYGEADLDFQVKKVTRKGRFSFLAVALVAMAISTALSFALLHVFKKSSNSQAKKSSPQVVVKWMAAPTIEIDDQNIEKEKDIDEESVSAQDSADSPTTDSPAAEPQKRDLKQDSVTPKLSADKKLASALTSLKVVKEENIKDKKQPIHSIKAIVKKSPLKRGKLSIKKAKTIKAKANKRIAAEWKDPYE